jgi:hypothetical protein
VDHQISLIKRGSFTAGHLSDRQLMPHLLATPLPADPATQSTDQAAEGASPPDQLIVDQLERRTRLRLQLTPAHQAAPAEDLPPESPRPHAYDKIDNYKDCNIQIETEILPNANGVCSDDRQDDCKEGVNDNEDYDNDEDGDGNDGEGTNQQSSALLTANGRPNNQHLKVGYSDMH